MCAGQAIKLKASLLSHYVWNTCKLYLS